MEGKEAAPDAVKQALVFEPTKVSWATAEFIRVPPSVAARSYIYIFTITLFLVVFYASFRDVAISIEGRGEIASVRSSYNIKAPINMKIGELKVVNDQRVRAGDKLVVSVDQLTDAEYRSLMGDVNYTKNLLKADATGKCPKCLTSLEIFSDRAFSIEGKPELRQAFVSVQGELKELATAERELETLSSVTASFRRQISVDREKLREIKKRNAEQILAMQVEQLNNEIISSQAQIADRTQGIETRIQGVRNKLDVELPNLPAMIEQYRSRQTLVAPSNGFVTHLKVSSVGQYFTAGEDLMEVVPEDTVLQAEIMIANKDISRVKVGLPVKLKLDALPEREFGALEGTIKSVPDIASSEASGANGPDSSYKVIVKLDRQSLRKGTVDYPFKLGMTLAAYIITGHDSLLSIGVRKFLNYKDELFRE
jgi:multidrug efflux pump subunit AcrA (membrane-fusion protein)